MIHPGQRPSREGASCTATDPREAIMPTVIREFARADAGEVSTIASGAFSSGKLLTAVHNGSDNLELIVWAPDAANRSLARLSDSGTQAGEVGGIALAMMRE